MWAIGDRVLAGWVAEASWLYPGTVCGEGDDGGWLVQFDDGDRAEVGGDRVRRLHLRAGDRVFGRWGGGPLYFPGEILQERGWAVHVRYDDGDEEWTSVCLLRVAG